MGKLKNWAPSFLTFSHGCKDVCKDRESQTFLLSSSLRHLPPLGARCLLGNAVSGWCWWWWGENAPSKYSCRGPACRQCPRPQRSLRYSSWQDSLVTSLVTQRSSHPSLAQHVSALVSCLLCIPNRTNKTIHAFIQCATKYLTYSQCQCCDDEVCIWCWWGLLGAVPGWFSPTHE